jgi:hypothetical protein
MSIFSALFARSPRYQVSAYGDLYKAIVTRLTRTGVRVGRTAGFPRVEVHTITESERLDKDGALRRMSLTVESMSNKSMEEAQTLNDGNLKLLTENDLTLATGWTCIGIIPTILQDLTETSETNTILYRLIQQYDIFIEQIKPTPAPAPTPTQNNS